MMYVQPLPIPASRRQLVRRHSASRRQLVRRHSASILTALGREP